MDDYFPGLRKVPRNEGYGRPGGKLMTDQYPVIPSSRMRVGFNLAWTFNDCGFNLGPDPYNFARQDPRWLSTLDRNLRTLKSIGVTVVRWFLLANGFNYGYRPNYQHHSIEKDVWTFDPPDPPDPRFAKQFEQALKIFAQVGGIQLVPSLISFEFFGKGDPVTPAPVTNPPTVGNFGAFGRADVANDPVKRDVFFSKLLDPLLALSADPNYRSVIYAWEVMNEPIWSTKSGTPGHGGFVTEGTLATFLQTGLDHIKKYDLPSTVGHRYITDLKKFPTGSMPQFHYYAHWITTPDPRTLPKRPQAFLGEFAAEHDGQSKHGLLAVNASSPWPELDGKDKTADTVVYERLVLLESKGYSLAMIWPDLGANDPNSPITQAIVTNDMLKLSQTKLDQIKKFTSRTP